MMFWLETSIYSGFFPTCSHHFPYFPIFSHEFRCFSHSNLQFSWISQPPVEQWHAARAAPPCRPVRFSGAEGKPWHFWGVYWGVPPNGWFIRGKIPRFYGILWDFLIQWIGSVGKIVEPERPFFSWENLWFMARTVP